MSNFLERIQQERQNLQANQYGDDNKPRIEQLLKNDMIQFDKNTSEVLVRILPPVSDDKPFAEGFRELFLEATNNNNKQIASAFRLPYKRSDDSKLDRAYSRWLAEERVPNRFAKKDAKTGEYKASSPSKRFYVNAILLHRQNDGSVLHETDAEGNPVYRLMKLPMSAYTRLIDSLSDQGLVPQNSKNYSFIDDQAAFPIKFTKPERGSGSMEYGITIYPNTELGQLPSDWRDKVEDLEFFAQPDEEYNEDFVDYFIAVVDKREEEYHQNRKDDNEGGSGGEQAPQQQGFNSQQQQQTPQQPGFNNQQQTPQQQGFGNQEGQAGGWSQGGQSQQGFNSYNQPQQNFDNQPPTQPQQQGFNNSQPQQQFNQPQQNFDNQPPTQPQQNQPQQPSQEGNQGGTSDVQDVDQLMAELDKKLAEH